MFAPLLSKAKADSSRLKTSSPQRSTLVTQPARGRGRESGRAGGQPRPGQSWDFSKIPVFPPARASRPEALSPLTTFLPGIIQPKLAAQASSPLAGSNLRPLDAYSKASGLSEATRVVDRAEVRDQAAGSGSAAPTPTPTTPAPAASASTAPATPTVDGIDLVNTPTGAISGYTRITSGDLNTPGPFNNPTTKGVSHPLQVHFHLGSGDSSALVPRREIQRTSTFGTTTSLNPPDKPAPGGIGPPTPGGFEGVVTGPDGPSSHEIKRPTTDKIVVADAPGFATLPTGSFPATYKAHFSVTVAAGSTDIASVNYDVLIEKRSPTDVPNKENRSFITGKNDLVRGQSLK